MNILINCLLIFGIIEIISNLFHISKGNVSLIAQSAKKQHQEIPLNSHDVHFFFKTIIMLIVGILFMASSILFLIKSNIGEIFTFVNAIILSLYGLIQLVIYYKTWKVWPSFLVYSIPLITYIFISLGKSQ